ncbi:hypothetical protein [Ruegeria arenilitoris]|uniref:hypothetical protein n=1 Tax=Ruegeria arenilitoris TaxID=1173585 RepID=UPI00147A342D|nr:hypothetical protein [Ruegeria arenilitoris]
MNSERSSTWWVRAKKESGDVFAVVGLLLIVAGGALATAFPMAATAIIGVTGALIVAFVAYPWQKNRDRTLQKENERREIYRRFLQAANGHYAVLTLAHQSKNSEGIKDSYLSLVTGAADLAAYAPANEENDVLKACQRYHQRLLEYGTVVEAVCGDERAKKFIEKNPDRYPKNLSSLVKKERRRAFVSIRMDLGETKSEAEHAATVYFVATPREDEK